MLFSKRMALNLNVSALLDRETYTKELVIPIILLLVNFTP